jgi:hypothetical protein
VFANRAAQKVEKYEIWAYESLIELAGLLGFADAIPLLEENLAEEQETADKLKDTVPPARPEARRHGAGVGVTAPFILETSTTPWRARGTPPPGRRADNGR